jgi:iron complex outermembrane receptor protein
MNSKIIFNPRKELGFHGCHFLFRNFFAQAQETKPVKDSTSDKQIEEVVLVGSRSGGRSKADSPVPVDVFNLKDIQQSLPQTNINQILNTIAPSLLQPFKPMRMDLITRSRTVERIDQIRL